MNPFYIAIGVVAFLFIVSLIAYILFLKRRLFTSEQIEVRRDYIDRILWKNIQAYLLLITPDFIVEKTNYYELTGTEASAKPLRVGELLRCKNGLTSGCGHHALCRECPVRAAITQSFQTGIGFTDLEAKMELYLTDDLSVDPVTCNVSISGVNIYITKEPHMLLTVYDISKQKAIQEELEQKRLEASKSERLKSAFIANISHEIRTPLNAIVGFSDLIAETDDAQEKKFYTSIIHQNNKLLIELIEKILDLSEMEAGGSSLTYEKVQLGALFSDLLTHYSKRCREGVILKSELTPQTETIITDRARLRQILVNLLSNAAKFTERGSISLGCLKREDDYYFYVKDTGIGIDSQQHEAVFDRFVKLNDPYSQSGLGLGLSVSQAIVDIMGGKIGVESALGKGSTFWFTLPLRRENSET